MCQKLMLAGTYRIAELVWLREHARVDTEGVYRCVHTGEIISSRVEHRLREAGACDDVPFTKGPLPPGDGVLISFNTLWCAACGMKPSVPDAICRSDLIMLTPKQPC